jgi:hypothetical protein
MRNPHLKHDNPTYLKNHEEILSILEEIKKFEQRYPAFEFEEPTNSEELIEIEPKPDIFVPLEKTRESAKPTVFRLRFTEDGKLENIDIKKPKTKKTTKSGILKTINIKKNKEQKDSKSKEDESKISRLIDGLKNISRLKRVIPSKNKTENEPTESDK